MAYTKSQAMAKNATPSTATPSKKISKQGKRRAPPAKSELPPKKPLNSVPSSSKPPPKKIPSAHSPNSKHPAAASSSIDIDSLKKFATSACEKKFEALKKKKLFVEKGFSLNVEELPPYLADVIMKHKWQKFCKPQVQPIVPLVHEFYANLALVEESCGFEAVVRGKHLILNSQSVNELFDLDILEPDDFCRLLMSPIQENYDKALHYAAHSGVEWDISRRGVRTLPSRHLTPEASVWLYFVKSRLMPTTHDSSVSADRMLLLYAMFAGLKINVGKLIVDEIYRCSMKKTGKLFFPSLITQLCLEAGVPHKPTEEVLFERTNIDFHILAQRFDSSKTSSTTPSASTPHVAAMISSPQCSQLMAALAEMQRRLSSYWTYAAARDATQRSKANKNLPTFPSEILEPWTTVDADPTSSDEAEE